VTLLGKDLREDQIAVIGEQGEKMRRGGEYQDKDLLTDLTDGEVALPEAEHPGVGERKHIENEVILTMNGKQPGAVVGLITIMKTFGGAHQVKDFPNGVMMIMTILQHRGRSILQGHSYQSKRKKEIEVKLRQKVMKKLKIQRKIGKLSRKVILKSLMYGKKKSKGRETPVKGNLQKHHNHNRQYHNHLPQMKHLTP